MRRVRAVHLMRRVFSPVTAKAAALAVSVISFVSLVSVPHVLGNMSHVGGFVACAKYLLGAFAHTELGVQSTLVLAVAIGVWFVSDIVRNVRHARFAQTVGA